MIEELSYSLHIGNDKKNKISEELNRKIDMICWFVCVKYEFIPGNIKSVKNPNR